MPRPEEDSHLTQEVVACARRLGADLVGIAPVERFEGAPLRMSPQGLLPSARCVVVAGIHHPDACVELGGEPSPQDVGPYAVQYWMNARLDEISFRLARFLERRGHQALPIAASNIWRYHGYKDLAVNFAPDLAHRYAAVAAGLGEIGWSGLCLTPQYGPRNRFVSVVTDAELVPSPMYDGPPLCDRCMECVQHCPNDVFRREVKGMAAVEIAGRRFSFPDTNKWRCAWTENFDLSLDLPVPERVDKEVVLAHLEKFGRRAGEEGSCLKFCMPAHLRVSDPPYRQAPRRRRNGSCEDGPALWRLTVETARKSELDIIGAADVSQFPDDGAVHPRLHLPGARTVVCLGVAMPYETEGRQAFRRNLLYAAMDLARAYEAAGHDAVCMTRINDQIVAHSLGILREGMQYTTVLTSGTMPGGSWSAPCARAEVTEDDLRRVCEDAGADLVGFFSPRRFAAFKSAWDAAGCDRPDEVIVEDVATRLGQFAPAFVRRKRRLRSPDEVLPGWKSVLVAGVKIPDASVDTAKVTPAETVGPYVFAYYEALVLLEEIALRVIQRVRRSGYRGVMSADLTGLASQVASPRGYLPDMRANSVPAVLAGLATVGRNGCPLTPLYGVRQRFICIVTDVPAEDASLCDGDPCASCGGCCVRACPTHALREGMTISCQGQSVRIASIDHYACDWAKRLGLSGKEGPAYCGIDSDRSVPAERTPEAAAQAVASVRWGVQRNHLQVCEECVRVCCAHRRGVKGGGLC